MNRYANFRAFVYRTLLCTLISADFCTKCDVLKISRLLLALVKVPNKSSIFRTFKKELLDYNTTLSLQVGHCAGRRRRRGRKNCKAQPDILSSKSNNPALCCPITCRLLCKRAIGDFRRKSHTDA